MNAFGRYVLHHSTPFLSFLLGNLEALVRMRKDTNLNTHPGPPTAGSGPGENIFPGLQQGWTGMGKSEKKETSSNARWPPAESTVNTTKSLHHYIRYWQKHTQHSRAPGFGNLYRLLLPPSTTLYTPMKMAESSVQCKMAASRKYRQHDKITTSLHRILPRKTKIYATQSGTGSR